MYKRRRYHLTRIDANMAKRIRKNPNYQTGILDLLINIKPETPNQAKAIQAYNEGKHLFLTGMPRTGKTFLALSLALQSLKSGEYDKLIIFRSTVPTREMGFLRGDVAKKISVYEEPYILSCKKLFAYDNVVSSYQKLKNEGYLDFRSTAFTRGTHRDKVIIFLDEIQNMNEEEVFTLLTRVGSECRIIVSGDFMQLDLKKEKSGFHRLQETLDSMGSFSHINFEIEDILSDFVKEFIKHWLKNDNTEGVQTLLTEHR